MEIDIPTIRGDVVVDTSDLVWFGVFLRRRHFLRSVRLIPLGTYAILVVVVIYFLLSPFDFGNSLGPLGLLWVLLGSVLPWVLILLLARTFWYRDAGRSYQDAERLIYSYEIDKSGMLLRDALGTERRIPWSAMRRGALTKRFFLYRLKPDEWRFIPLRCFQPADMDTLRKILTALPQ